MFAFSFTLSELFDPSGGLELTLLRIFFAAISHATCCKSPRICSLRRVRLSVCLNLLVFLCHIDALSNIMVNLVLKHPYLAVGATLWNWLLRYNSVHERVYCLVHCCWWMRLLFNRQRGVLNSCLWIKVVNALISFHYSCIMAWILSFINLVWSRHFDFIWSSVKLFSAHFNLLYLALYRLKLNFSFSGIRLILFLGINSSMRYKRLLSYCTQEYGLL